MNVKKNCMKLLKIKEKLSRKSFTSLFKYKQLENFIFATRLFTFKFYF
jgi:hypothetical protein